MPFIRDLIAVMNLLRGIRTYSALYDIALSKVLKVLSYIIVCRLTHIDKHVSSQLYIILGDIKSLLSKASF